MVCGPSRAQAAKLKPETVLAWERYIYLTESRIAAELESGRGFLIQDFLAPEMAEEWQDTIDSGGIWITKLATVDEKGNSLGIPSGMIHHWIGSVFISATTTHELLGWMQEFDLHQERFEQVANSRLISREGDTFEVFMKLRRKKMVAVHYNTEHLIQYRHHGPGRVSSKSVAVRIAQVDGTGDVERPVGDDTGFLWRLNSYWRYQEVGGGVMVECESVSLSRGIPAAIRWLVMGFVETVARESMEGTLDSLREGVALYHTTMPSNSAATSGR
jgi:hypothetical protein